MDDVDDGRNLWTGGTTSAACGRGEDVDDERISDGLAWGREDNVDYGRDLWTGGGRRDQLTDGRTTSTTDDETSLET